MLIKCPNCNAQYEVPNNIIPAAGREVQCSSCSKTWFVTGQSAKKIVKDNASNYISQEKGELPTFETTASFLAEKASNDVDANALEILREEADREIRARSVDGSSGKKTQNLLSKRAIKNKSKVNNKALPNNIEIGTTLEETLTPNHFLKEPIKYKNNSGKIGFFIGIVIISTCYGIYSYTDLISRSVPETAIYMDLYKNYIDHIVKVRDVVLHNLIEKITEQK
tara:strand:+ start:138 stop:809 length:672 start_codon:yes stop_codon:yes gene_type:complete